MPNVTVSEILKSAPCDDCSHRGACMPPDCEAYTDWSGELYDRLYEKFGDDEEAIEAYLEEL